MAWLLTIKRFSCLAAILMWTIYLLFFRTWTVLNADASVAAVFDVCHMLKLARNCLNEYQILVAPGDGQIRWEYVRLLQKKQNLEGLNLANKVTLFHVQYKNQKMKVRLAAQVISNSCASALEYLRKSGYPEFSDTLATENFLRKLDKTFYFLNCRSLFGKGYKSTTNVVKVLN